jgi:predicted MPP superfamily phosphohydrolase
VGYHHEGPFSDLLGGIVNILGVWSMLYLGRALRLPRRLNAWLAGVVGIVFFLLDQIVPPDYPLVDLRKVVGALCFTLFLICIGCSVLLASRRRIPAFQDDRRKFLKVSTAAVCAAPAVAMGYAIITRKDFQVNEVNLQFPNLPADLNGLRILQISDIHLGPFFLPSDLVRVVDAANGLRSDLVVVTGDLISDKYDPLDTCLHELQRLRHASGIWGCMGNHERYSHVEAYTQRKAQDLGMSFLRQQSQTLRFGNSRLNLVGVDYQPHGPYLNGVEELMAGGDFNLLLAHTPEAFPAAAGMGFDLTLSGHTHGGQLNLDLMGTNFNVVDIKTPYTKGIYQLLHSTIYVNSGLGTIGLPARLGAPAEITLIRLCNS